MKNFMGFETSKQQQNMVTFIKDISFYVYLPQVISSRTILLNL